MKRTTVLLCLVLVAAPLTGCTDGSRYENGTEQEAPESRPPVTAGVTVLPENTDADPADENVIHVSVEDAEGASTDCQCTITIEISNRVDYSDTSADSWTQHIRQQVEPDDFGALLGVEFVVDDGTYCGTHFVRATVSEVPDGPLVAETKDDFSCPEGESGSNETSGYADEGGDVEEVELSLGENQIDDDRPKEADLSIRGKGTNNEGEEEYYRFNGSATYTLKRETDAECLGNPNVPVTSGKLSFGPNDFEEGLYPTAHAHFQDHHLIDGESYVVFGNVTVNTTQNMFSRSAEFLGYFTDDNENQSTPAPLDEAEAVQSVSVSGFEDNEDSDAAEEVVVSIDGESGEEYESCRFAGSIDLTLEHEEGGYGEEKTYTTVDEWSYEVEPGDFSSGPTYEVVLQDDNFQDGESYRLTASVTMDSTGDQYTDQSTFYYSSS